MRLYGTGYTGYSGRHRIGQRALRALGLGGACALMLAAWSGTSVANPTARASKPLHGGTVTFAEGAGLPPNYIFPFMSPEYYNDANATEFQWLMYRPLYWYGDGSTIDVDPTYSLAQMPKFSDDDKVITIDLKTNYTWSDGEHVDAADVVFWMNLLEAEKTNWVGFVPGDFPTNVVSYSATSTYTVVFKMNRTYSTRWLTYEELAQITPIPLAWDVTSATAKGNCATSVFGCAAVYSYLNKLAENTGDFATSPIWKTVDGPWTLSAFTSSGEATFVPNSRYTGGPKPYLSKFVELPFTSDTSEYSVLKSGTKLDFGYLPIVDAPVKPSSGKTPASPISGYTMMPWYLWDINFISANFNNPSAGPIFKQLYFRQAVQEMIDQPGYVKAAMRGWGYPTYGPVPTEPPSNFEGPSEKVNPYPYDPAKAVSTLKHHGWKIVPNGVSTCVRPGTGPTDCGAGITAGEKLSFDMVYTTSDSYDASMFGFFRSELETAAGITLTLTSQPFGELLSDTVPCKPSQSTCKWQIHDWGGWLYGPTVYPTGGTFLTTSGVFNVNSFSTPAVNSVVTAADDESGLSALYQEEKVVAEQLPEWWFPEAPLSLAMVKSTLHGALPLQPLLGINPESWYFTK